MLFPCHRQMETEQAVGEKTTSEHQIFAQAPLKRAG